MCNTYTEVSNAKLKSNCPSTNTLYFFIVAPTRSFCSSTLAFSFRNEAFLQPRSPQSPTTLSFSSHPKHACYILGKRRLHRNRYFTAFLGVMLSNLLHQMFSTFCETTRTRSRCVFLIFFVVTTLIAVSPLIARNLAPAVRIARQTTRLLAKLTLDEATAISTTLCERLNRTGFKPRTQQCNNIEVDRIVTSCNLNSCVYCSRAVCHSAFRNASIARRQVAPSAIKTRG